MNIYDSLLEAVHEEFDTLRVIKKSERGEVLIVRHRDSGTRYIFRHFYGNSEVYQKLLNISCPNLPQIMEVGEKDGKTAKKEVSTVTGELPEGAVQFSPVEWKNGQASTTITTSETGYTLQYQIGEITEGSWTNTTSGSVIGNLQHGQIVYGRLFDGTNGSKTVNIDIKDIKAIIDVIDYKRC